MSKKSELLKKLGWNEELVRHFMVDDNENAEQENDGYIAEVYDTRTLQISFDPIGIGKNNICVIGENN